MNLKFIEMKEDNNLEFTHGGKSLLIILRDGTKSHSLPSKEEALIFLTEMIISGKISGDKKAKITSDIIGAEGIPWALE